MSNRIIGITGGIGAGKSVVSRILRGRGFEVFDCDYEAKRIMTEDLKVRMMLSALCGERTYTEDGRLNRAYLASLIFNDEELRAEVNRIVHSAVRREFLFRASSGSLIFVEAAIMASSGLANLCSEVWVVDAPEELRFQRALSRGGITTDDLRARMESQSTELSRLNTIGIPVRKIDNSGGSSVIKRIDELMKLF